MPLSEQQRQEQQQQPQGIPTVVETESGTSPQSIVARGESAYLERRESNEIVLERENEDFAVALSHPETETPNADVDAAENNENDYPDEGTSSNPIRIVFFRMNVNHAGESEDDATSYVSSLSYDDSTSGRNRRSINQEDQNDELDANLADSDNGSHSTKHEVSSMCIWDAKMAIAAASSQAHVIVPRTSDTKMASTTALPLWPYDALPRRSDDKSGESVPPEPPMRAAIHTAAPPEHPVTELAIAQEVCERPPSIVATQRTRDEERAEFARQVRRALEQETARAEIVPVMDNDCATAPRTHRKEPRRAAGYRWSIVVLGVVLAVVGCSIGMAINARNERSTSINSDSDVVLRATNSSTDATRSAPPSASPLVHSTKNGKQAFTSTIQLYEAVDSYVAASADSSGNVSESFVAITFGYPIGIWDVSRLSDFSRVFNANRDQKLESDTRIQGYSSFNDDLSGWDVSRARSMNGMFAGADKFVGLGLDEWNVSRVADFSFMFLGASSFDGNVTLWNTSSATTMLAMFKGAKSFNGDLSRFDTNKVENTAFMFNLASNFQGNGLSNWDVSNVRNMISMFSETCQFAGDLSHWRTGNVENMKGLFADACAFNGDLSAWRVDKVYTMAYMFSGAISFQGTSNNRSLKNWNTSRVTDMTKTFHRSLAFQGDVSLWDVSAVLLFNSTFAGCHLFNGNISTWNTSSAVAMGEMFKQSFSFSSDLSLWNVSAVEDMREMFLDAYTFSSELSDWDTSQVRIMKHMFANAHAFNSDVSGWNLSRVTDMTGMLTGTTTFRQNLCAWGPQLLQPNLTAPNAPPRFKANVEGMFLNAMACESTDDPSLQWHEAQVAEPVMTVGPFCTFCSIDNSTSG